jgi:hypothetical protein
VIGGFLIVSGWLASPTTSARETRKALTPALRDYPGYVYAALAIVVGIWFLEAPTQNLRSFLTTVLIAAAAAYGIHELRRQSEEENPDASYDDVIERTRERFVGAVKSANLGERASKLRLPEVKMSGSGEESGDAAAQVGGDGGHGDRIAMLERLGELREKGVLTDEEFEAEKTKVLSAD